MRDLSVFFFFIFYFLLLLLFFIRLHPPFLPTSRIHISLWRTLVRAITSIRREGGEKKKKKSRCWLWHWKEGSMSARRISRYFSTWNRRCTVEIRDDGYDLSSIRIIHLWSIDVNHSRTYFSSVIRKITKFYLLIYAFTWKEKYLFARVLFFFFFN